jgi:putative membrane protein
MARLGGLKKTSTVMNRMKTILTATALFLFTALSPTAWAASSSSRGDATFLRQSAQAALLEIEMGHLALTNSENGAVREFAEHLVQEHSAQLTNVQQLADQMGVTLPTALSRTDRRAHTRLGRLSGASFDRAWTREMVLSHQRALRLHERAAFTGRNAEVRSYARSLLVPLATHLTTALALHDELRNPTANPTTTSGNTDNTGNTGNNTSGDNNNTGNTDTGNNNTGQTGNRNNINPASTSQ